MLRVGRGTPPLPASGVASATPPSAPAPAAPTPVAPSPIAPSAPPAPPVAPAAATPAPAPVKPAILTPARPYRADDVIAAQIRQLEDMGDEMDQEIQQRLNRGQ